MWDDFREDYRLHCRLTGLRQGGWLRLIVATARSAGLLVLLHHRVAKRIVKIRAESGWTIEALVLRLLLQVLDPMVILLAKSDVLATCRIEPGVFISPLGNVVIGAKHIGRGTVIHHAVTIGLGLVDHEVPAIGCNAWIGPECVIHGNITIGDGATILKGTVVSRNLPPKALVQGNPLRLLKLDFDNASLRSSAAPDSLP